MEYSFKETWKETLLIIGTIFIFTWGIFNHFIAIMLSLFVVYLAGFKLAKKLKII